MAQNLSQLGCDVAEGEDIHRAKFRISRYASDRSVRIVAVVDIFEGWPDSGFRRNTPSEYVEFIFRMRKATKGTPDEIVFLLYHHSEAFERAEHDLSSGQRKLAAMWLRIQKELLTTEHD